MTDWQILIIGLLAIIAALVAFIAYGLWLHVQVRRINAPNPIEDWPLSRHRKEGDE